MENNPKDRFFRIEELQKIGGEMLREVASICEKEHINYSLMFGSMLGAVRHHGPIPWDYDIDIAVHENDLERFLAAMERELPERYWVDFRGPKDVPKTLPRIGIAGFDTRSLHIDVYRLVGFPDSPRRCKAIVKLGHLLLEMRLVKAADLDYYSGKKKKKLRLLRALLLPVPTRLILRCFDALCRRFPYEKARKVGINSIDRGLRYVYDKELFEDTILVDYLDFQVRIPREYDRILTGIYRDYRKYPKQETIDAAMNREYRIKALP